MKQYLLYPKPHSFEFPQAFRKRRTLVLWRNSHRLRPVSFVLVLKDCRPQYTCKNSCFTTGDSKYFWFFNAICKILAHGHRVNTWKIKNILVKLEEQAISSPQILHKTEGNEIMFLSKNKMLYKWKTLIEL